MGLFDRWKRSGATAVAERPAPVVPQPNKGIDSVGAAFEGYDAQYAYDETLGGYVKCANADVLRTHPELREALFELGFRWVGAFGVWHHAQPRKGAK
jgi:hypothetical protein